MEAFKNLLDGMFRRFNDTYQAEGNNQFEFLDALERDLEAIKSTGVVKFTFFDSNAATGVNGENHHTKQSKTIAMTNVKLERVSESSYESSSEMPPPQLPVKRAKKAPSTATVEAKPMRHTRSKTAAKSKNSENEPKQRDSDVVVKKERISVVTLSDSDDENMSQISNVKEPLRRIKQEKLSTCTLRPEQNSNRVTRSTKVLSKRQSSVYEDCVSTPVIKPPTDATFVCGPPPQSNNSTFVTDNMQQQPDINTTYCKPVAKETLVLTKPIAVSSPANNLNTDDLMTDDESMQESRIPVKYNAARTVTVKKAGKQIFSPYESSPVKKRVAEFEKLKAEEATGRITRTKTKNKAKQEIENVDQTDHAKELNKPQPKTKLKCTPQTSRLLTSFANSASKAMNHSSLLNSEIKLPTKAMSALKASQQEYKERELRRREKEVDAIRKMEELRQQQIEESKRKREERHLKAQQTREEQEKIKQKQLEQRRLKEEKYNRMLAERQEKRQKKHEENERKRKEALKKAAEGRQKDEEKFLGAEKEARAKMNQPIYMTQKAPRLPTDDCYDSDDEQHASVKARRPTWQQSGILEVALITQQCAGIKHVYTLFCCESQTPDLRDIFQNIDPKKLKRTSSAIWHKAPRFTMFHVGNSFNEKDEDEQYEDEEED